MPLEQEIHKVLDNFENTSSEQILEILNQIKPQFKNQLISEYLQGKIQKIIDLPDEAQKKKQCNALTPYLNWYLQGL
jgi:hypothetical protein